jgi:sugar/nucleoside kinase (ribokinase family)
MPRFDLICIGGNAADELLFVPRLPQADEKLVARFAGRVAGGLVANAACAAARLGLRVAWSGMTGGDENGRVVRDDFAHFGVDLSLAMIDPQGLTDFTVIMVLPDGQRTILVVPSQPYPPRLPPGLLAALESAGFGYPQPAEPEWFERFARAVHTGNGKVVVDLEETSPVRGAELGFVLHQTDILFTDRRGLKLATGTNEPEEGAPELLEMGVGLVVITQGEQGALAFKAGEACQEPAFRVPVVDTTGAGDCFHAAFLAAVRRGWPLERTLHFANAAAALAIQREGPRSGLPRFEEVQKFVEERSNE